MRQIVLDTETTGLEASLGHRIIEIGCVELINRRTTGRTFHHYLDPERDIDAAAQAVHGISRQQLQGKPRFADIAAQLAEFIADSELVIHNAAFDTAFLDAEFARVRSEAPLRIATLCQVLDTLLLAREMHPGQRNTLDALCKRYGVDNSHRDLHGALLDARILADVYLAMTGGQSALALGDARADHRQVAAPIPVVRTRELLVRRASADELAAHATLLDVLDKAARAPCLWRSQEADSAS